MTARTIDAAQQAIIDQFELFDDWTDRYQLLISMGKKTQDYPVEKRTDAHAVKGCQSQVWFDTWMEGDRMRFRGTSDAAIVAGLIAVLMQVYDNQTPADIVKTPPRFIDEIGFASHLTPTRGSSFRMMVKTLKKRAKQAVRSPL